MERETGFEPATSTLARSHSTTELFPPSATFKIPTADAVRQAGRRLDPTGRVPYSQAEGRRSQVAKAEVCKTSIHRFDSGRRLQPPRPAPSRCDRPRQRTPPSGRRSRSRTSETAYGRRSAGTHPAIPAGGQPETRCLPAERGGRGGLERRLTVRRATLSLTLLALLVAGASRAGAGGLDLRIGGFFPRGNETLFQDVRDLYLVEKSDFYGVYGGIEYNQVLMDNVEVGVHFDDYSRTVDTSYRDYTRDDGSEIRQPLKLRMAPARRLGPVPADEQEGEDRPLRGRRRRRPLLPVRGVRGLRRLPDPDGLRSTTTRPRRFVADGHGLRLPRPGRPAGLPEPRLRDRGRGPLPVGEGRHGRRLRAQRAGARQHDRPLGWTFTVGLHVRF